MLDIRTLRHSRCYRVVRRALAERRLARYFTHSTGHGVGLSIHEGPSVGPSDERLRSGNVITVEPGLYYPGLGGVRIEDVAVVTARGSRNLTKVPRVLEV